MTGSDHCRRSMRLKAYDYARPGAYFVTICTHGRVCLFGEVVEGRTRQNDAGHVATTCWRAIPDHFPHAELDAFVVMPNHVHGIVVISDIVGARHAVPLPPLAPTTERFGKPVPGSIPTIVRAFKSAVTKRINECRCTPGMRVWQRSYYEHVIRNDESLQRIRQYILDNPARWAFDRENPNVATAAKRAPGIPLDQGDKNRRGDA